MTTTSKGQRVIELICEIGRLGGAIELAMAELRELTNGDLPSSVEPLTESEPQTASEQFDLILGYMDANPGQACKASDICRSVGCSASMFNYRIRVLVDEGRVKRVKKGYYQRRGTSEL